MKLRFGVGTVITLILVLAIVGYALYRQRQVANQPPLVEHEVQGTTPRDIAPAPEFLLRHQAPLALTPDQVQRITTIAAAYRKEVAPFQRQLADAAGQYAKYMQRGKGDRRPTVQDIQAGGADVQRLSSLVATTRHRYWRQAREVLTAQQQRTVSQLLSQATISDLQ